MLAVNKEITWGDFATKCLAAMKAACCNINSFQSDVPSQIRSGAATSRVVYTQNCYVTSSGALQASFNYTCNASNLITTVAESTVNSEWNAYLSSIGVTNNTNKLISIQYFTLAMALYKNFLSHHVKPVYSRRNVYQTVDGTQAVWQGSQYKPDSIVGVCPKAFSLPDLNNPQEPTNAIITDVINRNIDTTYLMRKNNNAIYAPQLNLV